MPSTQETGIAGNTGRPPRRLLPFLSLEWESPRVSLFFFAVIICLLASALSGVGFVLKSPVLLLSGTVVWLGWFAVMFMVAVPNADRLLQRWGWLRRGAAIIIVFLLTMGLLETLVLSLSTALIDKINIPSNSLGRSLAALTHGFAYNDGTALSHQAAENLLRGENPYEKADIVAAFKEFGGSSDRLTPLRVGQFAQDFPYPPPDRQAQLWQEALSHPGQIPPEIESRMCYPAGDFLWLTPFLMMGLHDLRLIYAIPVLAALIVVIWLLPTGRRRLIFAAAAIVSLELWNCVASGETGVLCLPFLLLAWVLPRKNLWLSALFMGLAVATKQTAWFFLPFYLIMVLLPRGPRAAAP